MPSSLLIYEKSEVSVQCEDGHKYNFRPLGGSRGGQEVRTPPLEKSQNMGFLSITGLNPMENLKTTKLAFNVRPLSARQQKAISMAFRRRADDGPLKVVLGSAHLN